MLLRLALVFALIVAACSTDSEPDATTTTTSAVAPEAAELVDSSGATIPPPPDFPSGPIADEAKAAVDAVWDSLQTNIDLDDLATIGASGDLRLGWLLSDLLRFFQGGLVGNAATDAFIALSGTPHPDPGFPNDWPFVTDYMIAWDVPEPPGYADYKKRLYTLVEPAWEMFFDDEELGLVDWRPISWGGVLIDDRPLGDPLPCPESCIPAIDDPETTDAAGGDWYPDDAIVFGVTINGESRAYPKNIMEVHEMVNDTLGGRRIGMPYCTLCGSAQAFFTDVVPDGSDNLVLRTSGLLSRSNKVMYELNSGSMFDTFLGEALTGSLAEGGFTLEQATVVTSTWGDWKAANPDTTIIAQDGGLGRTYPADPLQGRDDDGPIFPVGDVDPRLPVQENVVGVITADGGVIAFPADAARAALEEGVAVEAGGVSLGLDGGGLRAFDEAGDELSTHQSFWFAWSQFHPETEIWES